MNEEITELLHKGIPVEFSPTRFYSRIFRMFLSHVPGYEVLFTSGEDNEMASRLCKSLMKENQKPLQPIPQLLGFLD
jgi:hypothetical protein